MDRVRTFSVLMKHVVVELISPPCSPLPAHALACIMFLIGLIGVFLHIFNRRQRKRLLLAAPPGSIAAIVSLTSRSGFGELLLPYDDEKTLERKLDGLRFRLDRRTGAILAEESGVEGIVLGPDDAMMSLLGTHHRQSSAAASHSSHTAYQVAVGLPPWERQPLRTPYDP